MESKTYELRVIQDLLTIPGDRIGVMLEELKTVLPPLCVAFQLQDPKHLKITLPTLTWTDDGKEDLNVNVSVSFMPKEK